MTINSKFNINDIVQHKFSKRTEGRVYALEIIEIQSQTCYAGTQIFYSCRGIIADKAMVFNGGEPKKEWHVNPAADFIKMREDELIEATQDVIDLIVNAEKKTK